MKKSRQISYLVRTRPPGDKSLLSRLLTSVITLATLLPGGPLAATTDSWQDALLGDPLEACIPGRRLPRLRAYVDLWFYRALRDVDEHLLTSYQKLAVTDDQETDLKTRLTRARLRTDERMLELAGKRLQQVGGPAVDRLPPPVWPFPYLPVSLSEARQQMRDNACLLADQGTNEEAGLQLDSNWHQYQALKEQSNLTDSSPFTPRIRDAGSPASLESSRQTLLKHYRLMSHAVRLLVLTGRIRPYLAAMGAHKDGTRSTPGPMADERSDTTPAPMQEIETTLRHWLNAWSQRDIDAYLAHYAAHFKPHRFANRVAWERQRRQVIGRARHIRVTMEDLELQPRGKRVVARFTQHYRSNSYRDTSRKWLIFEQVDGTWKIVAESNR